MKTMNKFIIISSATLALNALSFSTAFALYKTTPTNITVDIRTVGVTYHNVRFYDSFNVSSWNHYTDVQIAHGNTIGNNIPTIDVSSYDYSCSVSGWKTEVPTSSNYTASVTSTNALQNVTVNSDLVYYPLIKSTNKVCYYLDDYDDGIYCEINTDVEIVSTTITSTKIGYAYVGIDSIPSATSSWDNERNLTTSTGMYRFSEDNGAAKVQRKFGFTTAENTADPWNPTKFNSYGRGMWADKNGSNGSEIQLSTGGTTSQQNTVYIDYEFTGFYIKNYSYNNSSGKNLESGYIQLSEGYSSVSWVLHKKGDYWENWTVSNNQVYWGS